jgi:hypothetical protein
MGVGGNCRNCKYTDAKQPEINFEIECRRYAPRIFSGSGEGWSDRLYPLVNAENGWCGEFVWERD